MGPEKLAHVFSRGPVYSLVGAGAVDDASERGLPLQ